MRSIKALKQWLAVLQCKVCLRCCVLMNYIYLIGFGIELLSGIGCLMKLNDLPLIIANTKIKLTTQ